MNNCLEYAVVLCYTLTNTYTVLTVGFIGAPYSAREDDGPMIFTVGVTSAHTLDRDIVLSFSTADSTQTGIMHACM